MPRGQKHYVACRCFLHQHKSQENATNFAFLAFSVVQDDDTVEVSYAQCPNCGVIHKIVDICESEFVSKEEMKSLISLDEIKACLPDKLLKALSTVEKDVDYATWQNIKFCYDNELYGERVVLTSNRESGDVIFKTLTLLGQTLFKMETRVAKEFT